MFYPIWVYTRYIHTTDFSCRVLLIANILYVFKRTTPCSWKTYGILQHQIFTYSNLIDAHVEYIILIFSAY